MSDARASTSGLLIGYGSIGRLHATVLAERYGRLAIVDGDASARERAQAAHPDAAVVADLDELAERGVDLTEATAVIATWGPSHTELVRRLVALGVRRLLVEKPFSTSLADGYETIELAQDAGVRLATHLHLRYGGVVEGLHGLAEEHELGPIEQIVVDGGSRCLVTNGIHYLDLAAALWGHFPERVVSTAAPEAINPRSPDLRLYGGTAVWSFGEGRELVISFTNRATLYERIRVCYRNAAIDMSLLFDAELHARDPAEVQRDPSVTRAGAASKRLFSGPVPGIVDVPVATGRILDELDNGRVQHLGPDEAMLGVGAVIGALWSGETGTAVDLPLDPAGEPARRDWPMS